VTLEIGGKSPFIVFLDANLDTVVDAVADGIFYSTGEICDALSRALVHQSIIEEFTEWLLEKAKSYVLGDPLSGETTVGPLTSAQQFETVTDCIETGKQEPELLCGGGRPGDSELADGWYVEPTVFGGVTNEMTISQEDIFGPVQTTLTFEKYEEAIETAKRYPVRARRWDRYGAHLARPPGCDDLEAGLVDVNEDGPILPEAPYGGFKQSSFDKDLGLEAIDHYQRTKSVYVNLDDPSV
jgi:NAD-dependent aldehyde dehydrogenases